MDSDGTVPFDLLDGVHPDRPVGARRERARARLPDAVRDDSAPGRHERGVRILLLALAAAGDAGFGLPLVFSTLAIGVILFTLARFGMLALIVSWTVAGVLEDIPLTFNAGSMFAPSSDVLLAVIVGVAVYGCRTEPCRAAVAQWKVPRLISSAPA